ncbi:MAG TPA: helix-turn-helix domain-containing protein [Aeromicrobium sp.]|nr:helix-turn-helix domain-containing protein [Aeromicrobium sp.]
MDQKVFDTRSVRPADRLAFWHEVMHSQILPVGIDPRRDEALASDAMRSTSIGDLQVREVIGGEHLYERTEADVRTGDPNTLNVGLQLTGSSMMIQDGREAVMGAGDVVLYDSSRPFTLAMDARFSWQVFLLPKDKLRRSDREISKLTAVRIDAQQGVAGIVVRFLRDLTTNLDTVAAPEAAQNLCENASDLIATLVRSELGGTWDVSNPTRILLEHALAHISANLCDPELSPDGIAHAIGVSTRRLHQLFEPTGQTVCEHIRDERLGAFGRDLADPRLSRISIARLAAARGLTNPSLAARLFRERNGCTPSEFRVRSTA